jgi:hypothetical protein
MMFFMHPLIYGHPLPLLRVYAKKCVPKWAYVEKESIVYVACTCCNILFAYPEAWLPCIRAIVTESASVDVGTLVIITVDGGTIGRLVLQN